MWYDISLWFWFSLPWWLVMLNIFSCASWLSVCLLWKNNLFRSSAHLKNHVVFLCFYWVVWVLYIFWNLTLYQMYDLQIYSPILQIAFSFCWWFPLLCRSLLVWCILTCLFLLLLCLLSVSSSQNHHQDGGQGANAYVFL